MGVRITTTDAVAFYDSVTGTAFGPVFGSKFEAEEFLEWLAEREENKGIFAYGEDMVYFLSDPRVYRETELEHVFILWQNERKGGESGSNCNT